MKSTQITVTHVQMQSDKPFTDITAAFTKQLGAFDPHAVAGLVTGADEKAVTAKLEAMAGPSGFMLFNTQDHGTLLKLASQKRNAIQFVIGNPLFALQMTRHDIRTALYAPLRVLIYEDDAGKTCIEYDKPSSLFGQFGNAQVLPMATSLDRKLEETVNKAIA